MINHNIDNWNWVSEKESQQNNPRTSASLDKPWSLLVCRYWYCVECTLHGACGRQNPAVKLGPATSKAAAVTSTYLQRSFSKLCGPPTSPTAEAKRDNACRNQPTRIFPPPILAVNILVRLTLHSFLPLAPTNSRRSHDDLHLSRLHS